MKLSLPLAAAAAVLLAVIGGILVLRPGFSPNVGGPPSPAPTSSPAPVSTQATSAPSPSPLPVSCSLISNEEAATAAEIPDLGARAIADGTTCVYLNSLNPIMRVSYDKSGGQVAFGTASDAAGAQVLNDIGTDAIWDPDTGTLFISKDDALVTISTGSPTQAPADPIIAIAKLIASRI